MSSTYGPDPMLLPQMTSCETLALPSECGPCPIYIVKDQPAFFSDISIYR